MPVSASTPELQPLRAKLAAYCKWANVSDRAAETAPAREAFLGQFEKFPDPASARKAHFVKLALRSAEARALSKNKSAAQGLPSLAAGAGHVNSTQ